jgi:hypothetical protein
VISDETWDKVREAWAAGIPEQYRFTGREHKGDYAIGAIILPPPPRPVLKTFWGFFERLSRNMHLAEDQRREQERRANWGKRKSEQTRRSRSRAQPETAPTVEESALAAIRDSLAA